MVPNVSVEPPPEREARRAPNGDAVGRSARTEGWASASFRREPALQPPKKRNGSDKNDECLSDSNAISFFEVPLDLDRRRSLSNEIVRFEEIASEHMGPIVPK